MATPNPLAPVKGAGTTLWLYTGSGTANPLVDTDWTRLAQVKELTPGELTAESFDDTYIDDPILTGRPPGRGRNLRATRLSLWPGNPASRGKSRWHSGLKTAQNVRTASNTLTARWMCFTGGSAAWVRR
jgi:hypothetical protein